MKEIIAIDPDLCTGCKSCEMVCSLSHDHMCGSLLSRITISQWGEIAAYVPIVCQHCQDPVCETACPTKARKRVPETGAMITDERVCVGCKSCIYACPFGAPSVNPLTGKAMTCDLCSGKPQCIMVCAPGALRFTKSERASLERKRRVASQFVDLKRRSRANPMRDTHPLPQEGGGL